MTEKTIAIVGAGPVGLAAAAHALERGYTPVILEAGETAGASIQKWRHVRMFSPWRYNIDRASERLLNQAGWNAPDPESYPTGGELCDQYMEPLATRTPLACHLKTSAEVISISRVGFDKVKSAGREAALFEVRYRNGVGNGVVRAKAVIDASGTWRSPNPAGGNGTVVAGELENADRIAYGMPDVYGKMRSRYQGKRVAVVGAGHSAIGTLLDLIRLGDEMPETRPIWLVRSANIEKAFGGGANDQLAERGALGLRLARMVESGRISIERTFAIVSIERQGDTLTIASGGGARVVADELVIATGFRPELNFTRELRVALDPALECPPTLAPLIDPNVHSCGTVRPHGALELKHPESGFYIAGMKSYGRAPTFLMTTGYEQVRSIVADIAGDHTAAARVELVLPETGVCSGPGSATTETSESCCAPAQALPLAKPQASCCGSAPSQTREAAKGRCG